MMRTVLIAQAVLLTFSLRAPGGGRKMLAVPGLDPSSAGFSILTRVPSEAVAVFAGVKHEPAYNNHLRAERHGGELFAARGYTYPYALEHPGNLLIIYSRHRAHIVIRRTAVSYLEGSKP